MERFLYVNILNQTPDTEGRLWVEWKAGREPLSDHVWGSVCAE